MLDQLLLLAAETEGVPPDHIAATIVPIVGIVILCGSVYALLWSIYGAKKGALVYGTAFFAFAMVIGVYWWFGAPGTPIATGPKYFPYQESDRYQGEWFAMEAGSERAENFDVVGGAGAADELSPEFQTPAEFIGSADVPLQELEDDPRYRSLSGDLEAGIETMQAIFLPRSEAGTVLLGQDRRARAMENTDGPQEGERPAEPLFDVRVATEGEGDDARERIFVTEDRGLRVAAAELEITANYVPTDPDAPPIPRPEVVETGIVYAFKDPGAIWFPSAVWTGISAVLFLGCLFLLDRVEQREKQKVVEREPVPA